MSRRSLPDDLRAEVVEAEDTVEQFNFDVVGCVPVAMKVQAAARFQDAPQLLDAWLHPLGVVNGVAKAILKHPPLLGFAPKHFVVATRVERRVDVDQVYRRGGKVLGENFKVVPTIDD